MPDFIAGHKLAEAFYHEAAKPILERYFATSSAFGVTHRLEVSHQAMQRASNGPRQHKIKIETIEDHFEKYLGYAPFADITAASIQTKDWLCFPEHKLLGVTSGRPDPSMKRWIPPNWRLR